MASLINLYNITTNLTSQLYVLNIQKLEMWANVQRDGRPAEYR